MWISVSKEKKTERNDENYLLQEVDSIDARLACDPNNIDLQTQRQRVKLDLEVHASRSSKSAQVRSRIKYIEEGEKKTKFFLSLEKARANEKIMDRLKTPSGIITNQNCILEEQVKYYKWIYNINRSFNEDDLSNCLQNSNIPRISKDQ